jgi:Ca2+/Na+ antiporter
MSATGLILLIIGISCLANNKTQKSATFLALESGAMVGFWIYMLVFLILDEHQASATLIAIALFSNFVINYLWWEYYNDKLVKNDAEF